MASSAAVAAPPASTVASPLPLDAAPFLVAEVGGSQQTQYDLYELTNAFVAGQITARSLIYRPDLTGQQWLPIASSHPTIAAALAIPFIPPSAAVAAATATGTATASSSASAIWFYIDAQRQRAGPTTAESLHSLHRTGSVTDETLVWLDGWTEWLPFKQAMATAQPAAGRKQQHDDEKERADSDEEGEPEGGSHIDSDNAAAADSNAASAAHSKHRRKKRKKPTSANTAVYATGLPADLTLDEAAAFFKKAGVIREDIKTHDKRIKLYRDEQTGQGKGDATVNYMFSDSVPLALTLLDGAEIRPGWGCESE